MVHDLPQTRRVPRGLEVVEVERGVQLVGPQVGGQPLRRGHPHLAHEGLRGVVGVRHPAPLPEHVVDPRLVPLRRVVDLAQDRHLGVDLGLPGHRVAVGLDQPVRHVDAEAVHAAVEPEPQRLLELRVHIGVGPVQVRLGGVEQVQVPPAGRAAVRAQDRRPGPAPERAAPVGRRLGPALAAAGQAVVVPPRPLPRRGRQGLLEPAVVAGRVVRDDVDQDPQPLGVGVGHQLLDVRDRAEHRVDGPVVGDVVTAVLQRGQVERRDPQRVHAQVAQVGQPRPDAVDVALAVPVGVGERAHVDLVDHGLAPPRHLRVDGLGHRGVSSLAGGSGRTLTMAKAAELR